MTRYWTCTKCKTRNARTKQLCPCGGRRPAARVPRHRLVLNVPYERWVEAFGERCGICGREPSENRRLDRDHDHATGAARGLLCHRCNRGLPNWADAEWLRAALAYVERGGIEFAEAA